MVQRFPKPEVGGSNPLGDAIFLTVFAIFGMAAGSRPAFTHSGLTSGLTGRFATELGLCRHIGNAARPIDGLAGGPTTRLATACFTRERSRRAGIGTPSTT
jgi:hypothetical protein